MREEKGVRLVSAACPECDGTGRAPDIYGEPERCETCDGLGDVCDWEPDEQLEA